jgi:hypothetical protein
MQLLETLSCDIVARYENNAAFKALSLILWLGKKIMQLLETLSWILWLGKKIM